VHGVRYLVVGVEAVIYYGHARLTGDVDFFYDPSEDNVQSLHAVLDHLIANKQASGRPKDLEDLRFLRQVKE